MAIKVAVTDNQVTIIINEMDKCAIFNDSLLITSSHSEARRLTMIERDLGSKAMLAIFVSLIIKTVNKRKK